ncbi:glycosyl transferase family 4 [Bosea sp. 124]|nr:glycosyl transferase family 4 [Bosea sp. 124]
MRPFDVIEGPEYGADAAGIRQDWPDIPLIVRLHTPSSVINSINSSYVGIGSKLRYLAGGLRRGQLPKPYWREVADRSDPERRHTLDADLVVAPSQAILTRLSEEWGLPSSRSMVVPNVFVPPSDLLGLVPAPQVKTVLFVGKLEVRKGVIELAQSVPAVIKNVPDAAFIMVGRSLPMPGRDVAVADVMWSAYRRAAGRVTHLGGVPYEDIPALLARASIAVFPSVWENFPNVALEAMAAGRAVVASSAGGMAEMIEHGRTGLLVPPRDPKAIAAALIHLLRDPELAAEMGRAARAHVVASYGPATIGPLHEASLRRTIALAQSRRLGLSA